MTEDKLKMAEDKRPKPTFTTTNADEEMHTATSEERAGKEMNTAVSDEYPKTPSLVDIAGFAPFSSGDLNLNAQRPRR